MRFGLDRSATDGIDRNLGEEELPPPPPSGVFDARFIGDDINMPKLGLGSYRDFRSGDELYSGVVVHEIRCQTRNNSKLTIAWDLPENVTGHFRDLYDGAYVDKPMLGKDSLSFSLVNVVDRLLMTIAYEAPSLTIESPGEGDVLRIYADAVFTWSSKFIRGDVLISLSRDNGVTFDTLASAPNSGSFTWRVTEPPSDACILQISDSSGTVFDRSDAPFSIRFVDQVQHRQPPLSFSVAPNYPNPFNPRTTIRFFIPQPGGVQVDVLNVSGQLIRRLLDGEVADGWRSVAWNGCDDRGRRVAGGVYFYRVRTAETVRVGKMILTP